MGVLKEAAIIVFSTLAFIEATPSCELEGKQQRNLVCTSGDQDYVLQKGLVSDNPRTTSVILRACRITSVNIDSFSGLPSLEYLDLSLNKISELKSGVFNGIRRVHYLNLTHNVLSQLPLGLFDQLPNLKILDLNGNNIYELNLGIFDSLSNLIQLDVSNNIMLGKDFHSDIFNHTRKITSMDFSGNDMSGAPDILLLSLLVLSSLNLDRCSLTEVPKFATTANLRTMEQLTLSTNMISKLDDADIFKNLINLKKLILVDNNIEDVNENIFKPLKSIEVIKLRGNKIKYLPDTLFKGLTKLSNVDLSHNLIEFVPVNAFRGTSLRYLNLSDNRFTYLTDNFCLELKNSGANLVKFYFNQNPWQCACLRQTVAEVSAMGVEYNEVKYNGKELVCVTTAEFYCKKHQKDNQFYVDMYYNKLQNTDE